MTAITLEQPRDTVKLPTRKRRVRLAPWVDLFFGAGPIWCRLLRFGQRNRFA